MRVTLRIFCLISAMVLLLAGCGPSRAREGYDPGHRHAEEVGELTLPNGE